MFNPKIHGGDAMLNREAGNFHPHFKELRPMGIISQNSLNDFRLGSEEDLRRRPDASPGINVHGHDVRGKRIGSGPRTGPQDGGRRRAQKASHCEARTHTGESIPQSHRATVDELAGRARAGPWQESARKTLRHETLWRVTPRVSGVQQKVCATAARPNHSSTSDR